MIELTIEQHALAAADSETPTRVFDPVSHEVFVLVPERIYANAFQRAGIEHDDVDVGRLVSQAMAEYDEDDSLLASYQELQG